MTWLNCCTRRVTADPLVTGAVIVMRYEEHGAECKCACLYDLEYTLRGVEPGEWVVRAPGGEATVYVE